LRHQLAGPPGRSGLPAYPGPTGPRGVFASSALRQALKGQPTPALSRPATPPVGAIRSGIRQADGMRNWLIGFGIGLACLLASWGLLLLLTRRLPPGVLRDLAAFIPDCMTTVRRLRKDPRVPRKAKIAIVIAGIWVASPIDLIPEFIPIIGPLDDIVVVALALRYAGRRVPRDVLLAAWPGDPRLLERLLGPKTTS
jgi:uncharacterized membrane protein YkvA (DUF1232 family)